MSREIKFRAWDRQAKEMIYEGVEYQMRCLGYGPEGTDYSGSASLPQENWMGYGPRDYLYFDICQFTGLRDSQGREIYEGDIVDFTYWWFNGSEAESHLTGEVVYLPEQMSYGLRGVTNKDWLRHVGEEESDTAPFALWTFADADFEVLGNIFEHQHLLRRREGNE